MRYKVGDYVTIKKHIPYHHSNNRVPGFVESMEEYLGKTLRIIKIDEDAWIELEGNDWSWHDAYFEKNRLNKLKRILK